MPAKSDSEKVYFGSRKKANAFVSIEPGTGIIRYNGMLVEALPSQLESLITVPVKLAGDKRFKINAHIIARGGGAVSQAYAASIALARALSDYFKDDEKIRSAILSYDRHLLIGDPRQKEPKKFGGPGARRREQKSYR
ncbi:MAG: 30S ribosomal protein S9 [Nitrososphaerota archaeon]|jgi:small subunit ribosomal protein S9|nr:30S ribosomal protein S9 [Nitrososphaerota archaeon]MDG6927604.1 30S ribosomal protein S9 [Nitrososphaerota archaeon]MDG6929927.1 30S ribosomal protein S9 [Nitrososphaerota archaeon]MDG6931623.1 30S ribosomal protein S9 [Nitrososphaerota archaeon]MDG6935960.1 30S ribosomal protein S9 [Nitrososphaerota archaeon]